VSIAVWLSSDSVAATLPLSSGEIDQISATVPATCGDAIEVPLRLPYCVSLPPSEERTLTPGAAMFGLMIPPNADGPRDEKPAMAPLMSNAPAA
jgi:hypothetical protein